MKDADYFIKLPSPFFEVNAWLLPKPDITQVPILLIESRHHTWVIYSRGI